MREEIKKTLSLLLTVCFIISGLTISDTFVETVVADEGVPELTITGLVADEPVVYLDQSNTLLLSIANIGSADAINVEANVWDVIPNQNETLIKTVHFGALDFDEVKANNEKTHSFDWTPDQTGAHYIKVEITGRYLTHNSPPVSVNITPVTLSTGFPVTPQADTLLFWGPGGWPVYHDNNTVNLTNDPSGIREVSGSTTNQIEIRISEGLTIEEFSTLKLNEYVTLVMLNPNFAGQYGINVSASSAKFIINSPSHSTSIQSSSGALLNTYPFHNSGTIDFLGASVSYTHGDKTNTANPGGIQNHANSVCNLTDSDILWADSHSLMVEDGELNVGGSTTLIGTDFDVGQNTGTGITLTGNSNVTIENGAKIKNNTKHGIYVRGSEVSLKNCNINNNSENGIFIDGSSPRIEISNNIISDNGDDGIYLLNSTQAVNADFSIYGLGDSISENTILVKLKPDEILFDSKAQTIEDIETCIDGELVKEFQYSGVVQIKLNGNMSLERALKILSMDPRVLYAEPDYKVSVDAAPNDPGFGSLWGLHNTGQTSGTSNADINASEAWDISTGSGDVVVAVIDTGIDYNHTDLADNMWTNTLEMNGNPGVDDDGNGYVDDIYGIDTFNDDPDPMDDYDHGTHCAGTIGAIGDNGTGVVGVNWDVSIMALKFINADGAAYISGAIECLEYVIMMKTVHGVNVNITSNSWGWSSSYYSQALYDTIPACRDAEILFVAAAGNSYVDTDYTPHYPACYNLTNIISVTATDHNDDLFYNYGANSVDVAAPGININSTLPNDLYGYMSGTSMAAPHVAGLAALIASTDPSYNYANLKNIIMTTVDPLLNLANKTVAEGRINAFNALDYTASGMHILVHSPGDNNRILKGEHVDVVISVSDGIQPITNAYVNVTFDSIDPSLSLFDDGSGVDQVINDGYYSGNWLPQQLGAIILNISVNKTGYEDISVQLMVEVVSGGNIITNNTLINNRYGLCLYLSGDNIIFNNTASNNKMGLYISYSSNNLIANNNVSNNEYGIYLTYSRDNIITNNTASFDTGYKFSSGIYLHFSSGNTIINNTASNSFYSGISLNYADNNTIANNIADSNKYGIYFESSSSSVIINNTVSNNSECGIYIYYYSSDNILSNNIASSNNYGIRLSQQSTNNLITNSTISNSGLYDFYLDTDSHATTLNTSFNESKVYFNDELSTLTVQWFLDVGVVDENYAPVSGASVQVNDTFGDEVINATTDADGWLRWIRATEYVQNSTDTVYHTTHNITASNATLTGWAMPEPFMDRNREVYVLLGQGEGYNIYLHEGWNMVSIPFMPNNMSSDNIQYVLKSIEGKYDKVMWYDTTDPSDPWKSHRSYTSSFNNLHHINHTMGFWVLTTEECTLFCPGSRQTVTDIQLYDGWNLVGYPTLNRSVNISTAFSSIDAYRDAPVEGENLTEPNLTRQLPEDYVMLAGEGYWVHVTTDCTWTVDW